MEIHIFTFVSYAMLFSVAFYLGLNNLISSNFIILYNKTGRYVRKRVNAWRYLFQGADMITSGYQKAAGKAFEVPGPDHSHVFVSSSQHMDEIRKAPRDELSMFGATKQMFQPAYTMLGHNWHDERGVEGIGYVRAVGTLFPRQLLHIMPDMQRIVLESFNSFADGKKSVKGDLTLPAYTLTKKLLCDLNGFCFFGDELAKNEVFIKNIFEYNELVISAAEVLRVMPEFMKRIIGPYVGKHTTIQDTVFNMINELVTRRLEEKKLRESGEISTPLPCDMIQWIIDTAPSKLGWGSRRITYEVIAIWFGSVHALSATVTYVLFDLCEHSEYVEALRKEVESSEFDDFMRTTKGLPLLDSFIKESSRLSPIEAMSGRRQALKSFTFSDGVKIAKGDWVCVPTKAILNDATYFPHADRFEGFRFAPLDKLPANMGTVSQPEGPSRYSDLSENYHAWGIGGIVCPGRFYASVAAKLIVAHVLKNYDCSLQGQTTKKSHSWRSYVLPREDVLITFSPRK
ncbi:cytochrome P450 [Daldinia eschscholtzii]|nr:cytochrome P450 [Daldinia eschscholtzii]